MRNILLLLFFQLSILTGYAQNDIIAKGFVLQGTIKGQDSGKIMLYYQNSQKKNIADTMEVKNGHFSTQGIISVPTQAFLIGNITTRAMDDPNRTIIFLEPGKLQINLENSNFYDAKMTGSKSQQDYQELNKIKRKNNFGNLDIIHKTIAMRKEMIKKGENPSDNKELKLLSDSGIQMSRALRMADLDFLRAHPRSAVSLMLLTGMINTRTVSLDSARLILDAMPYEFKYGNLGQIAENAISQKKEELEIRAKKTLGTLLPEFKAKDVDGKVFETSVLKEKKYLLIDFWASWCLPCEEQSKFLLQLHQKYAGENLAFLGLSVDKYRAQWLKALEKNGTKVWTQVLAEDEIKTTDTASLSQRFAVAAYPTLILVDPSGKIIYKQSGFNGKETLAPLEEIFKNITGK